MQDYTPVDDVPELIVTDLTEGDGATVESTDTVTVHYVGALASSGHVFQASRDFGQPVSFPLNGVIEGWTKGLPGMKIGGKRRLLIPAVMAYGNRPPYGSGIPANANLVFDIELVSISGK